MQLQGAFNVLGNPEDWLSRIQRYLLCTPQLRSSVQFTKATLKLQMACGWFQPCSSSPFLCKPRKLCPQSGSLGGSLDTLEARKVSIWAFLRHLGSASKSTRLEQKLVFTGQRAIFTFLLGAALSIMVSASYRLARLFTHSNAV